MNFESLVGRINTVQDVLQAQAAHAINLALTARNWLVGYYIVEFEQNGEDRAKYGENLLNLASSDCQIASIIKSDKWYLADDIRQIGTLGKEKTKKNSFFAPRK